MWGSFLEILGLLIILGGRVDLSATKQGAGIPDWRTQEGSGPGGKQL